jgi:ABC-2 type transport system permease protein
MKYRFAYIGAMLGLNLRTVLEQPVRSLCMTLAMYAQDVLLFAGWIVFFNAVGQVRGWGLPELCLLYGMQFCSYGMSNLLTDGTRHLGLRVANGDIDTYLTRPRHVLPPLVLGRCNPANLGDFCAGVTLLVVGAGLGPGGVALALLVAVLMGLLFESAKLSYHSLGFFVSGGSRIGEYLTDSLYYLSILPQQGHGVLFRIVLFSALPAGFLVTVPVDLVRHANPRELAMLAGVDALYAGFALWFFGQGLKRYKRGE